MVAPQVVTVAEGRPSRSRENRRTAAGRSDEGGRDEDRGAAASVGPALLLRQRSGRKRAPRVDDSRTAVVDSEFGPRRELVRRRQQQQRSVAGLHQSSVRVALSNAWLPAIVPEPGLDLPVGVVAAVRSLVETVDRCRRRHVAPTSVARRSASAARILVGPIAIGRGRSGRIVPRVHMQYL